MSRFASNPGYYVVGTVRPCGIDNGDHVKSVKVTRIGYANDSLLVSCECGGLFRALTYAKPKSQRK